jgi:hypothetical protein
MLMLPGSKLRDTCAEHIYNKGVVVDWSGKRDGAPQ